ncbi:MAG: mannitol dehydrogenase family protein [Pseudolysinimonas sp.]|uniref:mannitol dehydrogenase family protein n=1 Tax=Pseudolysinimonas sp. TaxID=2680009 RepID=UPI00326415E3
MPLKPVAQPGYDPADLTVGIVHFGVGNFHRSHQALYLDKLFTLGEALDWAICGVGVLPQDARMRDALRSQNMRYALVERHPDGQAHARNIASIIDFLLATEDAEAVLEKLADPAVRIVSLTITEGGYNIDEATGGFDLANPSVAADLRPGAVPATVFGLVVEGLRRRRDRGIPPFTVMSCDNLQGNGHVARGSFLAFASAKDADLAAWIDAEVAFPNSMVDRITPVTGPEERAFVAETYGVDDAWPVVAEDFTQWVLEDRFTAGRPPYENVGVQIVDDVVPYEKMKLRLLNASHQAIAYVGYLSGHRFAHEAATDPLIAAFVTRFMRDEAEPTLGRVPGVNLAVYEAGLIERFANPYVRDTLLRLATDGSDRIAKFVLPIIRDGIAAGSPMPLSAAIAASWAVFASGVDEQGAPIVVADRQSAIVADALDRASGDPAVLATDARLFADLAVEPAFIEAFARAYRAIRNDGAQQALAAIDAPLHRP